MKKPHSRLKIFLCYLLITALMIAELILGVSLAENGAASALGVIEIILMVLFFAAIIFLAVVIIRTELQAKIDKADKENTLPPENEEDEN